MKRIVNKAKDHKEAEKWEIYQQINMTPEERAEIAWELKKRFYGNRIESLRKNRKFKKFKL